MESVRSQALPLLSSFTLSYLCAEGVDARGQRIEGNDLVFLKEDEDFYQDAVEQFGSPFYGETNHNNSQRSLAQTIKNVLILLITLIIIFGLIGALVWFAYKQYQKYKAEKQAAEKSSWSIFGSSDKKEQPKKKDHNKGSFSFQLFNNETDTDVSRNHDLERAKRNEGTSSAMSFGKMFGNTDGTPE